MLKNRHKPVIFAIVMLIIGVVLGVFFGKNKAPNNTPISQSTTGQTTQTAEPVLTVEAIRPSSINASHSIQASGAIVGKDVAQVGTKISGVAIDQILVEVGDTVKAGQVLAVLDDSNANDNLTQAQAGVVQAKANLQKASNDLARVEPLIKIDAISREQYESYQNAQIQAAAQYDSALAQLKISKTSKQNTQVIAPISGVISAKTAQIGMMTNGGVLFEIVKNGVLEWQATVAPSVASQITIGQVGEILVGEARVPVEVTRISPITNNARELIVHSTIAPSPLLRGGMYQSGRFVLGGEMALALPQKVITTTDGRSYVWTLTSKKNNYQARKTQVNIGQRLGDMVVVELPADTMVVKSGGNFLKDGDLVRVANAASANDRQ